MEAENKDRLEEIRDRYTDAKKESMHLYWNALLSVNGIVVAILSNAIFSVENIFIQIIFSLLILASLLACFLVLKNLRTLREYYHELGLLSLRDPNTEWNKIVEEKKRLMEKAQKNFESRAKNDYDVDTILIVQGVLICALIIVNFLPFSN